MEGAQPEPGLKEENSQPKEQASQKRSDKGWVPERLGIWSIVILYHRVFLLCLTRFSGSHLSYQEALPTGSWSLTIKHHRGQERPKPHRAGRRWGENSKQSEGVLTKWHHVFTQLQHFSSTSLKKKKKRKQMFKCTRKPYVTLPLGWELPSDKVQCCCLREKFINNCSADGTLARRRWFWCFNG